MTANRVLVPVSDSSTVRATVDHAVESVLSESTAELPGLVRFVYVHSPETVDASDEAADSTAELRDPAADGLLDRVSVWAEEDAGDASESITIETGHVGTDRYLFSPADMADALVEEALAHDIEHVIIDPEFDPGVGAPFLQPFINELAGSSAVTVEEAPVRSEVVRRPLLDQLTSVRVGVLFGVSFLFYQVLGGGIAFFDLVTGAMSAIIVTVALSRVTFSRDPDSGTPIRLLRGIVYVPYLLFEIVKSNIAVAAVILNPRLPIDPRLTQIDPAVYGAFPITTLANSITLTPGTLTVRVQGRTLLVHTLVPGARNDLFDGGLERAVRFVFYGRAAARIESLRDRGVTEILQKPPESAEEAATDGGSPIDGGES